MFRTWKNSARLHLRIVPRGPVLIKSGRETPDPTRPGMEFVRTRMGRERETVYLPGTSLKGALRSHAERVLAGQRVRVCDPLDGRSDCRAARGDSAAVFAQQCSACRTFGSLSVAGRCSIGDAYPWAPDADAAGREEAAARANVTETRWQVGIDRKTGEAHGGSLFDVEVVVGGEFHSEIHLENFQLWQLALVLALVDDMNEGHVPIGFGKSRGLGQVSAAVASLEVQAVDRRLDDRMRGAGALCEGDERRAYRLAASDEVALPAGSRPAATWRGSVLKVGGEAVGPLKEALLTGALMPFITANAPARREDRP